MTYIKKPSRLSYCARLTVIPVAIVLAFCTILAALELLGQPSLSPARNQHLGWQSWDIVQYVRPSSSSSSDVVDDFKPPSSEQEDEPLWSDPSDDPNFAPSLPLDNWDPLARHTTGLTEITIVPCLFPPWISPRMCSPKTTGEEDKRKGKWVRVERDLNARSGLWYLNVYYRRTRRQDIPLITSLLLLPESTPPPSSVDLSQYTMAQGDLHDGVWPRRDKLRLWYRLKKGNSPGLSLGGKGKGNHYTKNNEYVRSEEDDEEEIVTEIDVLYGQGRPFWGFERVTNGPVLERVEMKSDQVDLVIRKGNPVVPLATPPRFHKNGSFKILQIADLHFSVSPGLCRDTSKSPCVGDVDTLTLIERMLDEEKPDLVVFTGDQLNGQETSWDSKSVIAKVVGPVVDRKIPWTAIFGNHDSEIADDRSFQMKLMQSLPYSLAEPGPEGVDGIGNYFVKLYSHDASMMHLFTLYFLDAHARQPRKYPWDFPDYDYLKPSQIDWFLNTSASIKPIERQFTPDGVDDLGKIWKKKRQEKNRLETREQEKTLAKPNAMMFFHIPLAESYSPVDFDEQAGEDMDIGTEILGDAPGNSQHNGGFFENGLMKALAVPDDVRDGTSTNRNNEHEVKVVGHGHCHNTDKCRRNNGIWFCFGGGGSYSGYGSVGFDRRFRVYEISDYGETVVSWKRTEENKIIEKQLLVSNGNSAGLKPLQ